MKDQQGEHQWRETLAYVYILHIQISQQYPCPFWPYSALKYWGFIFYIETLS